MFYISTPVPRVPGLRGSDSARAENLDIAGPYRPLGGQPLFGSGSGDGAAGGGPGGYEGGCAGQVTTGTSSGGGNNVVNSMTPASLNNCFKGSGPPSRPNFGCPPCPPSSGGPGGPGGGPGCPPCGGAL